MLYQPTDMHPSSFGSRGNGVIDASVDNDFTALIDGGGEVNSYELIIYDNSAVSEDADPVYNTGKITLEEPFYTCDYTGKQQTFAVTVPANTLSNEPDVDYKWVLRVYEGTGDYEYMAESVEQFFTTALTPMLYIDPSSSSSTIGYKSNTWKAIYISPIYPSCFKWIIEELQDGEYVLETETQWIYNSSQIWFYYDGLISGKSYRIQASVINQLGVQSTSDWTYFNVSYESTVVDSATDIYVDGVGIRLDWSGVAYIVGAAHEKVAYPPADTDPDSSNYSFDNGRCNIGDDTYLTFKSSETFTVDSDPSSTMVIKTNVNRYDGESTDYLMMYVSDDGTHTRTLRHTGFVPGTMPDDEHEDETPGLMPGEPTWPSTGENGSFVYTYNNTTYEAESDIILGNDQVVIMRPDGLEVITV